MRAALVVTCGLLLAAGGCTTTSAGSLRTGALGVAGGWVLHEVCHLVTGAVLGAHVKFAKGRPVDLQFSGGSPAVYRTIAASGLVCGAIAAEVVIRQWPGGKDRPAWATGLMGYQAVNAAVYATSLEGDGTMWTGNGGSEAAWRSVWASSSARIIGQLLREQYEHGRHADRSEQSERDQRRLLDEALPVWWSEDEGPTPGYWVRPESQPPVEQKGGPDVEPEVQQIAAGGAGS